MVTEGREGYDHPYAGKSIFHRVTFQVRYRSEEDLGTTALIVEMVIIGFQVLIWMFLIILTVIGYEWIDVLKFKDWATLITLALVAVSYTLGIIFDSFIGSLFAPWERGSRIWLPTKRGSAYPGEMRAYIMAINADASEELAKRANRSSLVRATALNLVIISVTTLVFVQKYFGWSTQRNTLSGFFQSY